MATDFDMTKPDETVRFFVIRDVATFSIRIFRETYRLTKEAPHCSCIKIRQKMPKSKRLFKIRF